jgi:hypothetical protein
MQSNEVLLQVSGYSTKSLLKKASEPAIASEARNSSSPKANKKRDSMLHRTSKWRPERVFQQTANRALAGGCGVVGPKQGILDAKMRGRWQTHSRLDLPGRGTKECVEIAAHIRVFRYNRQRLG